MRSVICAIALACSVPVSGATVGLDGDSGNVNIGVYDGIQGPSEGGFFVDIIGANIELSAFAVAIDRIDPFINESSGFSEASWDATELTPQEWDNGFVFFDPGGENQTSTDDIGTFAGLFGTSDPRALLYSAGSSDLFIDEGNDNDAPFTSTLDLNFLYQPTELPSTSFVAIDSSGMLIDSGSSFTAVPEPTAGVALVGLAFCGFVALKRKRFQKRRAGV